MHQKQAVSHIKLKRMAILSLFKNTHAVPAAILGAIEGSVSSLEQFCLHLENAGFQVVFG